MKRIPLVALLLTIAACAGLSAQTFSLDKFPVRVVSLDGAWRFHRGDDPDGKKGWSAPGFDDSSWALVRSDKSWPEQGLPVAGGSSWYRTKILVPAGSGHLSLYMPAMSINYQVFRVDSGGLLTFANAGHLLPYRNGEEIQFDNGLPLGIAPDASYSETTLQLAPNDQLTFLSDGVVEAQSAGGDLFGFERTAVISTQSADAIARAAQQFGQVDDITVLTLTFAPAEVLHA